MSEIRVTSVVGENGGDRVGLTTGLTVGPLTGTTGIGATITHQGHAQFAGVCTATNVSAASSVTATTFYGSGANLTGISVGKILQVQSTTRTDTFSETIIESNYTAAALSVTINNVASGSKIFVMATMTLGLSNNNEVEFAFFKGGSIITGAIGATAGNRTRSHAAGSVNATSSPGFVAGSFLDTSPGTGSVTYDARLSHQNNGSATVYLNRSHSDTNADQDSRMASTITVFEIGS